MNTAAPQASLPKPCRHYRTKKMYIPEQAPDAFARSVTGESHCWCNLTMTEVGRDDRPVTLRTCQIGRACFGA